MHGAELYLRFTPQDNAHARELFKKAIDLDSEFARAYANLAATHRQDWTFAWTQDRANSGTLADHLAHKAVELARREPKPQPSLPYALEQLGWVLLYQHKNHEAAIAVAQEAVQLNPNYADGYALWGHALSYLGKPEEALRKSQEAIDRNPIHPFFYDYHRGQAHYVWGVLTSGQDPNSSRGHFEEAERHLQEALRKNNNFRPARSYLVAVLSELGHQNEAAYERGKLRDMGPPQAFQDLERFQEYIPQTNPYKDLAITERLSHIVCNDEVLDRTVRGGEIQGGQYSGTGISTDPDASARVTPKAICHFHAEMDTEVIIRRVTTVEVIVSREEIGRMVSEAAKTGQTIVDLQKQLIIQVIPKENFETVEDNRVEIDPPAPGAPQQCYFDVRPTHIGQGELWVIARQGQVSLITLKLHPKIVEAKSAATQRVTVEAASPEAPILQAPLHQLRIFEQHNGVDYSYLYELLSPALNILKVFRSSPLIGDRQQYVENLYKTIEGRWLSHQDDILAFSAELRAFGGDLWDQLFPEALQRILWEHRDQLNSIQVLSTEPFIPWELVHLKEPGRPQLPNETRFLGQMGMVRWASITASATFGHSASPDTVTC
jgi:hypothetical protein